MFIFEGINGFFPPIVTLKMKKAEVSLLSTGGKKVEPEPKSGVG